MRASPPADAAGSWGVCGVLVHTGVVGEIGKVCSKGAKSQGCCDDPRAMMGWEGELQFWEVSGEPQKLAVKGPAS